MGGSNAKPITSVNAEGPFRLVYFNIEGAGEKVRLCFVLAGIKFEDKRISFDEWGKLKPKTKYGQLPILQVGEAGEAELHQSPAILKYVALASSSKSLYPNDDPVKCVLIDEMLALCGDFQNAWAPCMYASIRPAALGHFDVTDEAKKEIVGKLRAKFVAEDLPRFAGYFSKQIEQCGGAFLCGEEPTIADCTLVPQLRYLTKGIADGVPTDCLAPFTTITAYIDRFMSIPQVAKWYEDKA